MARPREFDKDEALQKALRVFWAKGFAATSTDDLRHAMGIGRQSLYNAFGDKRQIYLAAVAAYQQQVTTRHLARLNTPNPPLEALRAMLLGIARVDDVERVLGCMGVNSVSEFGATDPELTALRAPTAAALSERMTKIVKAGQASGEIDGTLGVDDTVGFLHTTMMGMQVAARAGATTERLEGLAHFAVERLRAR